MTESHGLGLVLLQDAAERGHVRDKAVHPAKLDLYEEGKGSMQLKTSMESEGCSFLTTGV